MLNCVVPAFAQNAMAASRLGCCHQEKVPTLQSASPSENSVASVSRCRKVRFQQPDSFPCVLAPSCRSAGGGSGKRAPDSSQLRGRAAEAGGRSVTASLSARPSRAAASVPTATPGSLPSVWRCFPVTLALGGWTLPAVNVRVTRMRAKAEEGTASPQLTSGFTPGVGHSVGLDR